MAAFNLADRYRSAGLSSTPDILGRRSEAFESLRKSVDVHVVIDLARMYFGLAVPRGSDWFSEEFRKTDATFSLIDNAREAAVIASALLEAAASDGRMIAPLAVTTAAGGKSRSSTLKDGLVDKMKLAIRENAIGMRNTPAIDATRIKQPTKTKTPDELTALQTAHDLGKVVALLKKVGDEGQAGAKALAEQVASVVTPLAAQVNSLREEVEILWWYVGGWTRLTDKPFADLELGQAALFAGIDLADMSRSVTGPAAAPALLQRVVTGSRKGKAGKVVIRDLVAGIPEGDLPNLKASDNVKENADVCIVLGALQKIQEIGGDGAWQSAFVKSTDLAEDISFEPLELAMQVFRERLLLRALG